MPKTGGICAVEAEGPPCRAPGNTPASTECLTRSDKGIFNRIERTQSKIESLNIDNKRFKLVSSMFTLFLNLMLDVTESLSQGMGNLLRVRYSLLLRSNS